MEVEPRVNGTVHTLHGQRLVGSQRFQVGEVRLCREGREVEGSFRGMAKPKLSWLRSLSATGGCDVGGRGTCEDDGVEAGFAPQLHEVNHVPEAQGRVAGEHDARLAEVAAEVAVDAGVVL